MVHIYKDALKNNWQDTLYGRMTDHIIDLVVGLLDSLISLLLLILFLQGTEVEQGHDGTRDETWKGKRLK